MNDSERVAAASSPPRWSAFAALGLAMAGVAPLLMLVAGLVWGLDIGGDAAFFLVTAVIAFLGAFLVLRLGTWGRVAGIIAALLVGGALFWTAFGLTEPDSFFDFVPGILVMPGVFIAIGGSIAGLLAARRADAAAGPATSERKVMRTVIAGVGILAVLSAVLTFTSKSSVDEAQASAATSVQLTDFEFDPETLEVQGGTQVLVRNDDPFRHTFTVEALDIDVELTPGSEELVDIPAEAGTYVLYCKPHTSDPDDPSEDDMAGTLTVQ